MQLTIEGQRIENVELREKIEAAARMQQEAERMIRSHMNLNSSTLNLP